MRAVVVVFVILVLAPAAHAACPVRISPEHGQAPLRVAFRATCASAHYRWRFGDGASASGRTVAHRFLGGRFTPRLTTDHGTTRLAHVTSVALTVSGPTRADYGATVILHATVKPALPIRLGGRSFRNGELELTVTQPFLTAVAGPGGVHKTIIVRPRLDVWLEGSRTIGAPLNVVAVLRPAHAGSIQVRVDGSPTTVVPTASLHTAEIVISSTPKPAWSAVSRAFQAHIRAPSLAYGSRGPAVVALESRMRALSYALRDAKGVFDDDDQAAVYAFQKVHGLAPTGVVTPALWALLARATVPRARYPGSHVEVDKTRQVLFLVRDGKVVLTTHVSTGATGNTPVGVWHVYSKIAGWSWVLWYPSYFLRGFAIHGYPDVPPYPASHGCVRVPMWLAPSLFTRIPMGDAVYVYT
jgi:peptidoglycan hydrolase-like protein with peptidoglycan-binding domain